MARNNLGGITLKEVVTFQTQLMMGAQFGRVVNEDASADDLIIACLRMGWNDAFRHTSENVKDGKLSVLEKEENKWRKSHEAPYDDFICGNILNKPVLLDTFKAFAGADTTADKIKAIEDNYTGLENLFSRYKRTDGDRALCFGHFQKMFNIAIKLYVCLYLCHQWLDIAEDLFLQEILDHIDNADCPVDSIILGKLASKTGEKVYTGHKWSKYGTPDHPTANYQAVQDEISRLDANRLHYDFVAWKR